MAAADDGRGEATGGDSLKLRWLGVAVWVAVAALLLSGGTPVLGDYAEWTYHGVLLRDVLQGHPDTAYALKHYPVPNSLTTVGLGLMMLFLPWLIAAKVWLLCEVGLGVAAVTMLRRAAGGGQSWSLVVALPAAVLGIGFWAGFSNFLLGTYVAMMVCALLFRGVETRWGYGALLVAAFFSHMIPFGFAGLVLALYAVQKKRWGMFAQAVPAGLLVAWYVLARATQGDADGKAGMMSTVPWGTPLLAAFKVNTYLKCWGFLNPAFGEKDSLLLKTLGAKAFLALLGMDAVVGLALLGMMGAAVWWAVKGNLERRYFWVALAIFFAVALLMPGAAAGISDPGGRMMQVAVWSGLCVVGTDRKWLRVTLGVCGTSLLAANLCLLATVGTGTPAEGASQGRVPERLRVFGHVYYADRWVYYESIRAGIMDRDIYPTALFLKQK